MPTEKIFYKNLYQSISSFCAVCIIDFFLIVGYIISLNYGNSGWILLLIAISFLLLFFLLGAYWIFQKVQISKMGIKIVILGCIIRDIKWGAVESIKYSNIGRNPAYVLKIRNEKELHLDSRKRIKAAICLFGDTKVQQQMEKIK